MGRTKRPTGLTVLAVLGFIFAAVRIANVIVVTVVRSQLRTAEGMKPSPEAIALLAGEPAVMAILLLVASFGFLNVDYRTGYVGGNVMALVWLAFSVFCLVSGGVSSMGALRHFAGAAYSLTLLYLLNLRYREYFLRERQAQKDTDANGGGS